ncbi:2',3'-cyclic-nucleotide 3'-phosphodiesterase [Lentinula raphanica]|uniref:2',3'-cyclic-nucleotide 3'-phosphodiesterase n=1 Tax=Lentinula raphanica TaxID=153919 RepID=A0AA38P4S8_9AGAR|nr:2',3'-cyclic-nucleotide 3'-phosphodiesterase [Lentinula raphanica]KAJ3975106.1 2',3'-cyclic-nucleotide 3'-phosphodiesterase [Lentinula raphanica]
MVVLWIVPSDEDASRLQTIMSIKPTSATGSASFPKFHPHITLAALPPSSTLTLEQLQEIKKGSLSNDLQIPFKSVNKGDHFFRSVYIAIELTPALASLHARIHSSLDVEPRTPRFPHLSLCYITDEDDAAGEHRTRWKDQLEALGILRSTATGDGIELNCSLGGASEFWMSSFTAYEIWFVECIGPVDSWKVLDKVRI